jgi:hypothetical protein
MRLRMWIPRYEEYKPSNRFLVASSVQKLNEMETAWLKYEKVEEKKVENVKEKGRKTKIDVKIEVKRVKIK